MVTLHLFVEQLLKPLKVFAHVLAVDKGMVNMDAMRQQAAVALRKYLTETLGENSEV